jgi:hypothetical protein
MILQVFDKNWHKLHFGVFRDRVLLYADCEEVGSETLELRGPLDVNGRISIAKLAGSSNTVPVCSLAHLTICSLKIHSKLFTNDDKSCID